MVHIFYSDSGFRAQSKEELIGFTEFLCKNFSIYSMIIHYKYGENCTRMNRKTFGILLQEIR